jgi:succinyl-CoA synthetase beta subunit
VAKDPAEAATLYERLLGMRLVTAQTGPEGRRVRRIYLEEKLPIHRELYLSLFVDRSSGRVVVAASASGGMGVEGHAGNLLSRPIDPAIGPEPHALRAMAADLGLKGAQCASFLSIASALYRAFTELDCSLIEINPLAVARGQELVAADAKMSFDDSAIFRHPDLADLRDMEEESAEEFEASKYGLSFIKLDGSIGCLVNGAGLAMATLDAIAQRGGRAANFLDIGGSASEEAIERAFELLSEGGGPKAILVNVFGGIVRCDAVAEGIASAARRGRADSPLVVRFAGNRAEEGIKKLRSSGLAFQAAADMNEAAALAVAAARA